MAPTTLLTTLLAAVSFSFPSPSLAALRPSEPSKLAAEGLPTLSMVDLSRFEDEIAKDDGVMRLPVLIGGDSFGS